MKESGSYLYVNERLVSKLEGCSLTEVRARLLNSNSYFIYPKIHINEDLWIYTLSLDKTLQCLIAKGYKQYQHFFRETKSRPVEGNDIKLRFYLCYHDSCQENIEPNCLIDSDLSEEEACLVGLKHRLFNLMDILISNEKVKRYQIFDVWQSIGIIFYQHKDSFLRKYREFKTVGNPSIFIHASRGKSRNKKVTKAHVDFILSKWSNGLDSKIISEELDSFCELNRLEYLSRATVKKIIQKPSSKSIYGLKRYGKDFFNYKVNGYILRKKGDSKLNVIEADGSRFQIPYRKSGPNKYKVGYLTLYIVIDVNTSHVLGYSLAETENKEMVLPAFEMALSNCSYLPLALRIDKSSAHSSDRFKRFVEASSKMGMTTVYCHDPRQKSVVENFFRWFPEKICKRYPFYTGLGMKANDRNIKLPKEEIKRRLSSPNLPDRSGLEKICKQMLQNWSNRKNSSGFSPREQWSQFKIQGASKLEEQDIAYLTWNRTERKSFNSNTIRLFVKRVKKEYYFKDPEIVLNHFECKLQVFFHYKKDEEIYVFSHSGEYIGKAHLKITIADNPFISDRHLSSQLRVKKKVEKKAKQKISTSKSNLKNYKLPYNPATCLDTDKEHTCSEEQEYYLQYFLDDQSKQEEDNEAEINSYEKGFEQYLNNSLFNSSSKSDYQNVVINDIEKI